MDNEVEAGAVRYVIGAASAADRTDAPDYPNDPDEPDRADPPGAADHNTGASDVSDAAGPRQARRETGPPFGREGEYTLLPIIIKTAASLVLGVLAGFGAVYIFNRMPASWLCDYGEKPPQELTDPHIQRVKGFPWRWIYAAGFACLLVRLSFFDMQFAAAGLFACWAMLIIGLADLKYMIIPDQFVIMLALSATGFIPWQHSIWQPLLGALIGGGVMLMTGVLGGLASGKEALGFGDVKLFASLGLVLGIKGTVAVLICASLSSGIIAAIGMARGRYRRDDRKPLGPHICGWGIFWIFIVWPMLTGSAM